MKKAILIALLFIIPMQSDQLELTPIQSCIIQWQEYEVLIQYMLRNNIIDVRFLMLDGMMMDNMLLIWEDYTQAERTELVLERGLMLCKKLLEEHHSHEGEAIK